MWSITMTRAETTPDRSFLLETDSPLWTRLWPLLWVKTPAPCSVRSQVSRFFFLFCVVFHFPINFSNVVAILFWLKGTRNVSFCLQCLYCVFGGLFLTHQYLKSKMRPVAKKSEFSFPQSCLFCLCPSSLGGNRRPYAPWSFRVPLTEDSI